ncbi:hypothetical protein KL929_002427 [Ogataea haglerorum]|uniref:Uncharacterized protein n=1 Tax=Ogataea haglerorum TaxID=1937702 RepID=A0ABQ7RI25_9ASCO|nr:uncharacterized protein KL911_002461 [Ogataea haglerorum]KAG7696260.1 hypothetical protein KL915_002624 [Ogataea haglerorum]KAG7706924.1 hypothetical protein KL914_002808 [Ogataea haglerorum]KAG7708769.1 hypothetical protein KL950_002289 [Ogataea haglerorum]KAG7716264.1 hypothetical protein KL913_003475 [Ogataea haglerorum]KAG7717035.1 hypothetical protein KL949_003631 [Ogataea haglerorum]
MDHLMQDFLKGWPLAETCTAGYVGNWTKNGTILGPWCNGYHKTMWATVKMCRGGRLALSNCVALAVFAVNSSMKSVLVPRLRPPTQKLYKTGAYFPAGEDRPLE